LSLQKEKIVSEKERQMMRSLIDRKLYEEEKKISKILEQVCLKADIKLDSLGYPINLNKEISGVTYQTVGIQTDNPFSSVAHYNHSGLSASGKLFSSNDTAEDVDERYTSSPQKQSPTRTSIQSRRKFSQADHRFQYEDEDEDEEHQQQSPGNQSSTDKTWEEILIEQLSKENDFLLVTKNNEIQELTSKVKE
jgi:hypothetical protein